MGKILAFLTILRKNIDIIIIIRLCTLRPSSFVASQSSRSSSDARFSVVWSKLLRVFGALPCRSVESWKTSSSQSHCLMLSLSYDSFTGNTFPVFLRLLLLPWSSFGSLCQGGWQQCHLVTVVPPATLYLLDTLLHFNFSCRLSSTELPRSGFSHLWLALVEFSSTGSRGQKMAWLV